MPGIGDNVEPVRRYLDRIVKLSEEKQTLAEDIKEIYTEVKSAGYDVRAMRLLVKEHMESPEKKAKREEVEQNAELMRAALGAFVDSPLGAAAMERAY